MIEGTRFALFLSAALLLALTPGPGILYVLGRTLNGGRREGALSCLGTFAGGSVHVLGAALGLSAVLATSATAFQIVRYAGAAYLVYLGITMIRNRDLKQEFESEARRSHQHVLQGITTEVLNPKTALFFPVLYSSVRLGQSRTRDPAVPLPGNNFRCLEHSRRPDRCLVRRRSRATAQEQPQVQSPPANRIRRRHDRPRHLRRRVQIESRYNRYPRFALNLLVGPVLAHFFIADYFLADRAVGV